MRTSPVESLYVEANEAPLSLRREKLALQYYTKLQSCPSNPAFECTINPKYKECFARKESTIPTFGIRIQSLLDDSNIENNNVHKTIISEVSPWTLHHPKVNLDLSELSKKDTSAPLFIQKFNEIKDDHSYCTPVYTDGSKDNDRVGCGAIINNLSIKQRLPSNASIFTAEATAIDLALDAITESDDDHFIIFSDSLSVLLSLKNKKMDNPLILKLFQKLHHLSCAHKTIHFCWIPSHIGIRGNEAADVAAKESLSQDCIPIYTDGSKDNDRVGCGLIINNLYIKQRLPSNASIFTAEVTAIDLALDTIAESDDDHFIIFSDSLSVLLSLHNKEMDNPLILQLLQKLHHLSCAHKTIHLCWIPSHIGIRGNEAADMAAKESLDQDITASQVPYTDL